MATLTYVGPYPAVDNIHGHFENGDPVEVDDVSGFVGSADWLIDGKEAASPDDVPDGNTDDVLKWVGDDLEKAAAALTKENTRPSPRKGVYEPLGVLLGKES